LARMGVTTRGRRGSRAWPDELYCDWSSRPPPSGLLWQVPGPEPRSPGPGAHHALGRVRVRVLNRRSVLPCLVLLVVSNTNACRIPSRTPAHLPADMALGGSGYANTINSYPTGTTCFADLRDHAVRLMKRRGRHGLRRCCDGQCKDNAYEPDHSFLRCEPMRSPGPWGGPGLLACSWDRPRLGCKGGVAYPLLSTCRGLNRSSWVAHSQPAY
jgi:hypothetical protein